MTNSQSHAVGASAARIAKGAVRYSGAHWQFDKAVRGALLDSLARNELHDVGAKITAEFSISTLWIFQKHFFDELVPHKCGVHFFRAGLPNQYWRIVNAE
jgi:hypothetical protein